MVATRIGVLLLAGTLASTTTADQGLATRPVSLSFMAAAPEASEPTSTPAPNQPLEAKLDLDADTSLRFEFSPYLWLPFIIDLTSTVNGASVEIDVNIGDVLEHFDVWGLAGHLEAQHGNWFAYIDGNYVSLDTDVSNNGTVNPPNGAPLEPSLGVDISIEQLALDLVIGYRFFETDFGAPTQQEQPYHFSLAGYAGTRYNMIEQKINLDLSIADSGFTKNLGTTKYFFEPLLGLRTITDLNDKFGLATNINLSGFGVGSGTDLTISALTGMYYRVNDSFDLRIGYRVYSIDYSTGSGTDKFGMDGVLHGPYITGTIRF